MNIKSKKQISNLPIYKFEKEIRMKISSSKVVIIMGETGSGKTTQIPKIILKNFSLPQTKQICITQPRRVAAISLAERVSDELSTKVGDIVGFSVRFKEKVSKSTKIKFLTDGMLLRECIIDPNLSKYSYIILDEVHERSINTDILLAICKNLIINNLRPDLKLVIMSATLNPKKFMNYFNTNDIVVVKGRNYPVKIYNVIKEYNSYVDMALSCIMQIITNKEMDYGDILVFLPGQEDIEDLQLLLNLRKEKVISQFNSDKTNKNYNYVVLPLFSSMPYYSQMKIFSPNKNRKIILATNIAETSITIKNIKYIIDTGLFKERKFIHNLNIDTLKISKISKNSSIQRTGRAGRESDGICFRLYNEKTYNNFKEETEPEIFRINLRSVVLQLMSIGFKNLEDIDFIDKPKKENYSLAYEELISLKALNRNLEITELGKKMSMLPVEPIYSIILLNSLLDEYEEVQKEILIIISLLQSDNIFYNVYNKKDEIEKKREKFINPISDHLTYLNIFIHWKESENKNIFCKENFLNDKALSKANDIYIQLGNYLNRIKKDYYSNHQEILERKKKADIEKMINFIEDKNFLIDNAEKENKKQNLIFKCLLTGMFNNIAKYSNDNYYVSIKGNIICKVHPTSCLIKVNKLNKDRNYIIFNEMIVTSQKYLKFCSLVKEDLVNKYLNKNNLI